MGRCNGRARTVRLSWPHCALSIVICGLARTNISGPADPVGKRIGAAVCAYVLATGPLALRGPVRAHVALIRNTPLLIQLYVIFFALPDLGLCLDANHAARVIDLGAYATETLRPGAQSIPAEQIEAGRALNLSRIEATRERPRAVAPACRLQPGGYPPNSRRRLSHRRPVSRPPSR